VDIWLFYAIGGLTFLFSLVVRQGLKNTYNRWSQVPNRGGVPGARVARTILDANGLGRVPVEATLGKLTDHYDPRSKIIRLSIQNYQSPSVAAMAVSAHETGHALQDADDYGPMELRTALAPIAQAGSRFGVPLALLGSVFGTPLLVQVGVLAYLGALLLFFLTLPVEFNASKRALAELKRLYFTTDQDEAAARSTLRAAAMTYVAGVASAAGYIVFLAIGGGRALIGKPKPPLPPPTLPPA
jgi:Zn-dependent membrane protease YugP